ncbi:hypothetical protein CY35_05G137400 [Sphagnum magellanicum]|nr:hypothetical protein CY35_05G137400 [Sphagnum magellanicum]
MTTVRVFAMGTPLLRVGDLLRDLADPPFSASPASLSSSSILSSSTHPLSSVEGQNLQLTFEKSYNELNTALAQNGHSWTGISEKLCAALAIADKLVATAHLHLGLLLTQVHDLQFLLERGCIALVKLKTAVGLSQQVADCH